MTDLFAKYDVPAPRYTSYPTVPFWTDSPTTEQWIEELNRAFADESAAWSLELTEPEWSLGYAWDIVVAGRDATPLDDDASE